MAKTFDKSFQNQILTKMSKAYLTKEGDFVAPSLAPQFGVKKTTGEIRGFGTQGIRNIKGARAVGGGYKKIDFKTELTDQWNLQDHGFSADIWLEELENADSDLNAQQTKARLIMNIMKLNYEIAVASQITVGNIPLNTTLSGTSQWSDYINSTPVTDIDGAKEAMRKRSGRKPNSILVSQDTFVVLKRHPKIIAFFTNVVFVTEKMLKEIIFRDILGFENVYIGLSQYDDINLNTSTLESGVDLVDVWNNMTLLFYTETPTLFSTSFMKTFVRKNGISAGTYKATDEEMKRSKKRGGVFVAQERDIAFVDNRCGYLFQDTVS